ncbi:hypothetical protein ALO94_200187 [Pseudomonas syringae pv. spinaceae]|uniref:MFS transporter n=3 Tax=Pseudomonas syringae group TaxID=136849 RepID=A0A0Q0EK46_PSESX|nr:membrane dipeptidase [Pseudomonas syringae]KPY86681.1 hypothetical protein ALO94_200187 [Pseudomonas syringae pv. spinaceae]
MPARRHTLVIGLVAAIAASVSHAQGATVEAQLIEQGQYWQARSNAVRAAEIWQKVLLIDANQVQALYGMGLIGVKQNKPQQAQTYLTRLQALSPVPWQAVQLEQDIALGQPQNQALLDDARRLADAGERDKATGVFRQLFNGRLPQGTVGREYYTNLGFNNADWPEARNGFERLMRQNSDDSILALFFAKHLARREDSRAEGIAALARLSTHPDIAGDADQSWRMALVWIGPPAAAQVPLFDAFLKVHPDDQEIRDQLNKGRQQHASGTASGWQQDPLVARGLKALEKNDHAAAEEAFAARLKIKADDADALGGLSEIGKQAVQRLNDLGVIIDVSQMSSKALLQVSQLSRTPMVASHSAPRALVDIPRNLSDDELQLIKQSGGVVQIVAFPAYLKPLTQKTQDKLNALRKDFDLPPLPNLAMALMPGDPIITVWPEQRFGAYASKLYAILEEEPKATVKDFVDAIDYTVRKIGIDHVGISSDFNDGGGVKGFNDVSEVRNVTAELIERGYAEADITKLWGGNFLRVWEQVQASARPAAKP